MGPWGPKMGVPPKKAPIFKEDAFPCAGATQVALFASTTEVVVYGDSPLI